MESSWYGLVERAKNFHGYVELPQEEVERMEPLFKGLQAAYEHTIAILDKSHNLSGEQLLRIVFAEIYHNIILSSKFLINSSDFSIFDDDSPFCADVFNACFFTALATFINASKRVKGMSIGDFLYKHSSNKYNITGTPNYFAVGKFTPYKSTSSETEADLTSDGYKLFEAEMAQLRKLRHRLLSKRPVYNKRSEWAAIPESSEHEWALNGIINSFDEELVDTYKRLGNLNNDLNTALLNIKKAPQLNETHYNGLEHAFDKFLSKLDKIKYENFLKLLKKIMAHICEDKTYYGMNIYRFEKELRLYNITTEVKSLLECKTEEERDKIIAKSIALNEICFPKLYQDFGTFDDINRSAFYKRTFMSFMGTILFSSHLIFDALVEKGYFGENWEKLFVDTINDMTETVFYNPDEIDYTVTEESEDAFFQIMAAPGTHELRKAIHDVNGAIKFRNLIFSNEDDL